MYAIIEGVTYFVDNHTLIIRIEKLIAYCLSLGQRDDCYYIPDDIMGNNHC